ncbi:hypothetical protein ACFCV3_16020 [Kribbella sp. NPDC056345]|uniref:hypothetical protein n=1 Tax=Kribbella sp. NPDC056345 TaxID=3345789 RepID=UPI0035DB0D2A
MNLQDLRTELTARAEESAARQPDLLPGIRHKIRRTKQRRTATALASVAAVAILAVAVVPGVITTSTPDPAEEKPSDYIENGRTVPGMVGSDKLLKAWIGDKNENKVSFAWTPTTKSINVRGACESEGYAGFAEVRIWVGDAYAGRMPCNLGADAWASNAALVSTLRTDSPLWLDSPIGKPTTVTAQVVSESGELAKSTGSIQVGLYSTPEVLTYTEGLAARTPPVGPDDYQSSGVVYRKQVGGDTLLGAAAGEPGAKEVRFSFTSTGAPLVLHGFCTANSASTFDAQPYEVQTFFNDTSISKMTCEASSTDAGRGSSHIVPAPPAGQQVEVVARIVAKGKVPAPRDNVRLGLGIYAQGKQRVIDGVGIAERVEFGGYDYQLAQVREAAGPSGRVTIDTPADKPFLIAYGSSELGIPGEAEGEMSFRGQPGGIGKAAGTAGGLGSGLSGWGPGPAGQAEMKVTKGKPTKGKVFIAIYLPA